MPSIECMWTETWNKMLIQCEYKTNEPIDKYGRAYCKEHRIKAEKIRRLIKNFKNLENGKYHKNYYKEKLRLRGDK